MTINARGVFWRRSEITATTVSCARRGGLGTYFCAAPGALNGQDTAEGVQRSLDMSGSSPPACELPVLRRTNDDLKITIRPPVCTVVGDSTTSGGAMLRNLTIMESVNEEAGTRARDSARLAARRPGRRHQPGAVSVHGRPLCRPRSCERVRFRTK